MPAVVRHGDRARKGGAVQVRQQLASSDGAPKVATVGELFACIKHPGPPEHVLMNGCWFNRVGGKPVAIAFVTKASCGCRIVTGSPVYACCKHLDAKAKRLAEREALIEGAREMAKQEWMKPEFKNAINRSADTLERLNRDVRFADASVAVYGDATDPRFTSGFGNTPIRFEDGVEVEGGNSPEGMIRLNAPDYFDQLPPNLRDRRLWSNPDSGFNASLYYDELSGEYIVAYRGTQGLSDPGDLESNFLQAHGLEAPQYNRGMTLGRTVAGENEFFLGSGPYTQGAQAPVHFTGHSLGGGLASAAGTVADVRYTSFNSAGLHTATVPRFTRGERSNADGGPLGRRYFTSKDPITRGQTADAAAALYGGLGSAGSLPGLGGLRDFGRWSSGRTGGQLPRGLGDEAFELPNHAWRSADDLRRGQTRDAGWLGGHSMMTVVQGIESEKAVAQSALQNLTRSAWVTFLHGPNPPNSPEVKQLMDSPVWESW